MNKNDGIKFRQWVDNGLSKLRSTSSGLKSVVRMYVLSDHCIKIAMPQKETESKYQLSSAIAQVNLLLRIFRLELL